MKLDELGKGGKATGHINTPVQEVAIGVNFLHWWVKGGGGRGGREVALGAHFLHWCSGTGGGGKVGGGNVAALLVVGVLWWE